jgi:2-C-methyl-D-erythritol 4-phosphate cytidylyltransferase
MLTVILFAASGAGMQTCVTKQLLSVGEHALLAHTMHLCGLHGGQVNTSALPLAEDVKASA